MATFAYGKTDKFSPTFSFFSSRHARRALSGLCHSHWIGLANPSL
jgi:hypothetical protein